MIPCLAAAAHVRTRGDESISRVARCGSPSCAKTPPVALRGFAIVISKQAADALAARERTIASLGRFVGFDEPMAEALMNTFSVIVNDIFRDNRPQMRLPKWNYPVLFGDSAEEIISVILGPLRGSFGRDL